jgi:hypothetical protein
VTGFDFNPDRLPPLTDAEYQAWRDHPCEPIADTTIPGQVAEGPEPGPGLAGRVTALTCLRCGRDAVDPRCVCFLLYGDSLYLATVASTPRPGQQQIGGAGPGADGPALPESRPLSS